MGFNSGFKGLKVESEEAIHLLRMTIYVWYQYCKSTQDGSRLSGMLRFVC